MLRPGERLDAKFGLEGVRMKGGRRWQGIYVMNEAPSDRTKKLLTDAFLLTGLRVRRDVAARIFRGVRAMHESDTYLAILNEGQEKAIREGILVVGDDQFGPPDEAVTARLAHVTDLKRLKRMP